MKLNSMILVFIWAMSLRSDLSLLNDNKVARLKNSFRYTNGGSLLPMLYFLEKYISKKYK